MKYEMFSRVALKANLPKHRLRRGDVATIVEHHQGHPGQEPGYTLEVFNAVGETVDVVTVRESQIEPLTAKSVLHVRPLCGSSGMTPARSFIRVLKQALQEMDQAAGLVGAVRVGNGVGPLMGFQIELKQNADVLPAAPAVANGFEAVAIAGLNLPGAGTIGHANSHS